MTTPATQPPNTGGFTLVEILVSMTILSVASLSLGTLLFQAARQAGATSSAAHQTAAMTAELGRLGVLPFDLLVVGNSCVTLNDPAFPHTRCTDIVNISSKVKQVTVTIAPSGDAVLLPASTTFRRTISGNGNPLKTL